MKVCANVASTLVLLALASAAQAQQEPLGRLFFTPEQRAMLDRQRQRNLNSTATVDDNRLLTINGRVTRSSGRNTEWINGVPLDEQVARTVTPAPLQPGESSLGLGKERTDLLNGGTIRIHRAGNPASH